MSVLYGLRAEAVSAALREGHRLDGRGLDVYRPIVVETNISKNAEGSCRVRIGETEVLAGVKCLPGDPFPDTPNEGSISVSFEMLPIASPDFEPGPPSPFAIELARVVDRGIRESKAVDFAKLCIKSGGKVWIVFVDLYPINDAGNLFDACSIAALKALQETRFPKLDSEMQIVKGEFGDKLKLERLPLECTFVKIGDKILVDPTAEEEKAMSARFTVGVTEDDYLTAFQKGGAGSFSESEIHSCIELAIKKTRELRKMVFK